MTDLQNRVEVETVHGATAVVGHALGREPGFGRQSRRSAWLVAMHLFLVAVVWVNGQDHNNT